MTTRDAGSLIISRRLRERWSTGDLQREWASRFPFLFDENDLPMATDTAHQRKYHLAEWLGAIVLHHSTGYLSLVEKYQKLAHPRKLDVVARLGDRARAALTAMPSKESPGKMGPDLLMYAPDYSDFFFCEVKGPGDTLDAAQLEMCARVAEATGSPVRILRFDWE